MLDAAWPCAMRCIAAVLAALAWGHAAAEVTTTVVDVPTRDVTQRFLYVRPDAPVANIVFLPGREGVLDVTDDGSMDPIPARCAPFIRTRDAFAARGFALALVDRTSDGKVQQYADVREVVDYVRRRDDVPTWIVGGSGSTFAALSFAGAFPPDEPLGVVIFSPGDADFSRARAVKRSILVIYHQDDARSRPRVDRLFAALNAAPVKERIGLEGGRGGEECGGHHLFMGIDSKFVAAVADFIDAHNFARR